MKGTLAKPKINGSTEYGWAHISLLINGVKIDGFTAIEYKENGTIEPIYGAGNTPRSYGIGNHEFSGSVTVLKSEVLKLVDAARAAGSKSGDITSLQPFSILISYLPISGGEGSPRMDILEDCLFTGNETSASQSDTSLETSLELFVGSISWGVA